MYFKSTTSLNIFTKANMPWCLPRVDDDAPSVSDSLQFPDPVPNVAPPVSKKSIWGSLWVNVLMPFSSSLLGASVGVVSVPVAAQMLRFSSVGIQAGSWARSGCPSCAREWRRTRGVDGCGGVAERRRGGLATCTVAGAAVMGVGATIGGVVGFGAGWWAGRRRQAVVKE